MCSTVLWTINHAAYTPGFRDWTRGRLGVEPRVSPLRIDAPELVGRTAVAFTLPLNMCDCGSAVGYGEGKLRSDVPGPEDYAAWLRELPGHARFTSRVCVVRTWNPEGTVRPGNTERFVVSELMPPASSYLQGSPLGHRVSRHDGFVQGLPARQIPDGYGGAAAGRTSSRSIFGFLGQAPRRRARRRPW